MQQRSSIGAGALVLVAILALIFGALAGGLVGRFAGGTTTRIIQQASSTPGSTTSPASVSTNASGPPLSWEQVARQDGPAVVTIINQQQGTTDMFGNPVPGATAEGTGFIINHKGDIVTNNHVVANAAPNGLNVVFQNGKKVPATLVRADVQSDLAVIKVGVPVTATLSLGNSAAMQPGDPVLAIGSALGEFRNTVTSGVVSAQGRTITEQNNVQLHDMIQTDAAINHGNSGGPLLNVHGQVVGVNTAIAGGTQQTNIFGGGTTDVPQGLGFAIPSNTVKLVVTRLLSEKPPAYLGVDYAIITQQDATYYNFPTGAYVQQVVQGSPAAKAGLRTRDIITKVNGTPLSGSSTALTDAIYNHFAGDTVTLTVWRSGKTMTLHVKLGAKSG